MIIVTALGLQGYEDHMVSMVQLECMEHMDRKVLMVCKAPMVEVLEARVGTVSEAVTDMDIVEVGAMGAAGIVDSVIVVPAGIVGLAVMEVDTDSSQEVRFMVTADHILEVAEVVIVGSASWYV